MLRQEVEEVAFEPNNPGGRMARVRQLMLGLASGSALYSGRLRRLVWVKSRCILR